MKIALRPPCAECPFLKKSAAGWLGGEPPETVFARVHSDDPFGYPCHMDAAHVTRMAEACADRDDIENMPDMSEPDSVEQCVGAILHAAKTAKRYEDKFREAAREALNKVVGTAGVLGIEFIDHHKKGIKRGR